MSALSGNVLHLILIMNVGLNMTTSERISTFAEQAIRDAKSKPLDAQIQQATRDLKWLAGQHPDLANAVCVSLSANVKRMKNEKKDG